MGPEEAIVKGGSRGGMLVFSSVQGYRMAWLGPDVLAGLTVLSVDLHIGPQAPAANDSNWLPTNPRQPFEVLVRFYGPEPALFDKTWRLPDIERID
jgi:hypothetical protein